jgi:hypothetical protein
MHRASINGRQGWTLLLFGKFFEDRLTGRKSWANNYPFLNSSLREDGGFWLK